MNAGRWLLATDKPIACLVCNVTDLRADGSPFCRATDRGPHLRHHEEERAILDGRFWPRGGANVLHPNRILQDQPKPARSGSTIVDRRLVIRISHKGASGFGTPAAWAPPILGS
jgi:hypothetical protein